MDTSLLIISWTLSSLSRWSLLGYVPCASTCTHPLLLLNNNVVAVIPVYYYRHSINLFLMLFCCYFAVDFCFRLGFSIPVNLFKPQEHSLLFLQCYYLVILSPIEFSSVLPDNFLLVYSTPPHFKVGQLSKWSLLLTVSPHVLLFAWHLDLSGRTRLQQLCYKILPQYLNDVLFWFRWDTYYRLH